MRTQSANRNASETNRSTRHPKAVDALPSVDHWRLTSVLGRGATAIVYAASPLEQPDDVESDYAIKVLHPEFEDDATAIQRLAREVTVARQVYHPNLVTLLSAHLQRSPYYVVMPRLRGTTLAHVLSAVGRCNAARALWIARQVAEALGALHAAGWVHLDVKPANIQLDVSGHCTLIDLDLGLPIGTACRHKHEVRGTLAYTAPELLTSTLAGQPVSDVYSLGVMLYESLSGNLPFQCRSAARYVEAHLRQIPASVRTHCPELPSEVSRLITRMLAKQPDRRPSADGELQCELARLEIACFAMRDIGPIPAPASS